MHCFQEFPTHGMTVAILVIMSPGTRVCCTWASRRYRLMSGQKKHQAMGGRTWYCYMRARCSSSNSRWRRTVPERKRFLTMQSGRFGKRLCREVSGLWRTDPPDRHGVWRGTSKPIGHAYRVALTIYPICSPAMDWADCGLQVQAGLHLLPTGIQSSLEKTLFEIVLDTGKIRVVTQGHSKKCIQKKS